MSEPTPIPTRTIHGMIAVRSTGDAWQTTDGRRWWFCAGPSCPGLPHRASDSPHPASCAEPCPEAAPSTEPRRWFRLDAMRESNPGRWFVSDHFEHRGDAEASPDWKRAPSPAVMAARIVAVVPGEADLVLATRGDADEPARMSMLERMTWIARRFPSLRGQPGIDPFDATRLLAWSQSPAPSAGAFHAACCVLAIYNREIVRFDAIAAIGIWDTEHRDAFVAWARGGWLP